MFVSVSAVSYDELPYIFRIFVVIKFKILTDNDNDQKIAHL